jgi:Domain of unknown function (DUF4214)
MGITFTDYGTSGFNTQLNTQQSPSPVFSVTSVRQNEIDFSINFQGATYQLITKGTFDPSIIVLAPTTVQDILNSGLPTSVTNFSITSSNNPVYALAINPGITLLSLFSLLRGASPSDFSALNGDDVYYTNSVAKDSDIYLYGGNDTIYENHLLAKYNDLFYGGDGTNTVVYQGKSTNFSITYSNTIKDNINSTYNLEGFIVKDNTGIINTAQLNQIQTLQFSDKTVDLTPFLSSTKQGVTIQNYGTHVLNTYYDPTNTGAPPPDQIKITNLSNTEIDGTFTVGSSQVYFVSVKGLFDTSIFTAQPKTFLDLENSFKLNPSATCLFTEFDLGQTNDPVRSEIYSKAINFSQFTSWANPASISDLQNFLAGNDVYYTPTKGDDSSHAVFYGFSGDDTFYEQERPLKYSDNFYGGDGIDTAVYAAKSTAFTIASSNSIYDVQSKASNLSGFVISDNTKALNTLQISQVEKIQFSDFTLDTTSLTKTAALPHAQIVNLVELYVASFNRAPDSVGLDYWGGRLSDGMSLQDIAKSFFVQKETIAAYPTTMSTNDFVTAVYNNVLSRGPDTGGLNYWVGQLNNGSVSKDAFLLAIINGAMAATGSAVDRQTLANKEAVGEHYAIYQGLNNSTYWAKDVMSNVTDQAATVTAANFKADAYAAIAANPLTSDLVVKLVGVAV